MFKMILSAVFAMGMGSVAFADNHEANKDAAASTTTTTTTETKKEEAPAPGNKMAKKKTTKKMDKMEKKEHTDSH